MKSRIVHLCVYKLSKPGSVKTKGTLPHSEYGIQHCPSRAPHAASCGFLFTSATELRNEYKCAYPQCAYKSITAQSILFDAA